MKNKLKKIKTTITLPFRFLFKLPNYILPHRLMKRLSPRNRKIVNLGFITLLLVLGGYFIWTLITPNYSDAAWWNDNWMYRQVATITNSNGSNLTNFQVLVEVNTATLITAGKMKSNCSDIRFTDEGGNLLPYWIETGADACNTSSTNIWLKVPNVYTTGTTVLFYYGNSSAQPVQNGNQVFELFDDFSGSTLDTSKWEEGTIGATSGTNFTVSGGLLSGGNTNRFIRSNAVYTGDYTAEARSFTTTDNANGYTTVGFFVGINDDFGILDHNNTSYYRNDSNWVNFSLDGTGQWTKNTTKVVGTDATYARVGETSGSSTATVTNSGLSSEYIRISARYDNSAMDQNYVATWDWITVRKAAATDPTASFGSEQKSEGPVLYFAFDEGTGTTTKDGSPSKITGTFSASPSWIPESQCIVGSCLFFDGSNTDNNQTVIYTENTTSPTNITGDVTISAWIKPSSDYVNTSQAVLRNGQGADLVYSMFYDPTNQRPFFHWYDGGFPSVQGTTNSVLLDEWSFVTIVRESNVVSFYVNGKLTNTANVTTPTVPAAQMAIGRTNNAGVPQDYSGYLDELKIYPYARSAEQVLVDFNTRGGNATSSVLGATQTESLSQGLVGYWKMDESSWNGSAGEVIDSSGSLNNGTAVSGANASPSAKFGNAGYFAGVDERVLVPSSAGLNLPGAVTLSAWVYLNGEQGDHAGVIVGRDISAGGSTEDYAMVITGYGLGFNYNNGSTWYDLYSSQNIPSGQWAHIAVTRDSDGEAIKYYINGNLTDEYDGIGQGGDFPTNPVSIGADTRYLATSFFDGNIDEARIYNRELTPEEIANLYNFAPGPVGYWNFEQGQGGTVLDSSTYGNNGAWVGTGSKWGVGKYGKGGVMNGTDDGVEITASDSLKPGRKITVEAWVKMDSYRTGSEWSPIVEGAGNLNTNSGYYLGFDTSNALTFYVGVGTAFPVAYTNESAVPLGKWTHIAGVMDDSTISLYVNGALVNSASHSYPSISYTSDPLKFGRLSYYSGAGHDMDGTIDEVRIYNYARTPSQIVQDMNAGHPTGGSPVASQVGYWKFNEGYGTNFGNSGNAGDAINGTFDSTAAWSDGGKFGRALKTNGSATGDASIPDNSAIDFAYNQDFTVSFWMKDGGGNGNDLSVVEKWAVGGGGYPYVFRYVSNSIRFARYDETNNPQILGTKPVNDGNWHYVLGTKNGSTLALYIDGKLQSTTTDTTSGTTTNASPLFLGSRSGTGQLWNGFIDELKIYNSGFTQSQVNLDMNQGSSQVMGAFGLNPDGTASNSAAQTYCVPGDFSTASCKPIGEWNFEEGLGVTTNDTSTNGRTGTLTSGPTWTTGKVGKALSFDGSDDYVNTTNGVDISSGDWTMEAWIYPTAYGASVWRHIFGSEAQTFALGVSSGSLAVTNVTVADCTASSITPSLNTWSYVAATFVDSSNTLTYYVNGSRANAVTCATTPTAGRLTQYIGRSLSYPSAWSGKIDQARIYNYVRTPAQIAWDYNKGKPVGHWKLDECQGSTANDSSDFRTLGTITIGGSGSQTSVGTCQTASTAWGNGVVGKFNYSLNFDGTDDYITVPDTAALSVSSGPSSWFAWIKGNSISSTASIIRKNTNEYVLATVGSKVWCEFEASATINGGNTMSNGTWYHVGCAFDGTTLRSYLNGIQQDSTSATAGTDSNNSLSIGSSNGASQFFNGQIDDVQVFNYGLTNTQIKNLYNQSSAIRFGPNAGAP